MQNSFDGIFNKEVFVSPVRKERGKSIIAFPDDYVVLDIETTGLNPRLHEILELSALKIKNSVLCEKFNTLVCPSGRISSYISNLTGITPDMTVGAPAISDVIKKFDDFCENSIIVGHNIRFDIGFINHNLLKYCDIPFSNDYIDTLRLSRILLPELVNKKLSTIAKHFGFDTIGMHRGLKDCEITNFCFTKFKEIAIEKFGSYEKICK